MATDATGTPSTNWLIPKFLTSADAPSGKGLNAIVDYLDTLLKNKFPGFSSAITGTPSSTTYLRGDGSWASISSGPGAPATTLPGSPTDGQQAILVDSTSAPTYSWLFQYSSTASKWLFIGGAAAFARGPGAVISTTGWVTNGAPSLTIPAAGDYIITATMNAYGNVSTQQLSFDGPGLTVGTYLGYHENASGNTERQSFIARGKPTLSGAGTVQVKTQNGGTNGLTIDNVTLSVLPVAVT